MVQVDLARSPADVEAARALMREYQAEIGVDLCFQGFQSELAALPGDYAPPRGRLLLAREGERVVGCVALRDAGGGRCEMKRLFIRPDARGLGAGRALVDRAIEEARALGYDAMVLDTLPSMVSARALYETLGFADIAPYRENPVPGARYLGRTLRA